MNWDAIGAIGELVGAMAVVMTLAYLAIQIKQGTRATRAQTRSMLTQQLLEFHKNNLLAHTSTDIILKRLTDAESLTPAEIHFDDLRMTIVSSMGFRYWENVHYQYRNGMYDDDEFQAQKNAWREVMSGDSSLLLTENRFRENWPRMKHSYSPSFVALVDSLISDQAN